VVVVSDPAGGGPAVSREAVLERGRLRGRAVLRHCASSTKSPEPADGEVLDVVIDTSTCEPA